MHQVCGIRCLTETGVITRLVVSNAFTKLKVEVTFDWNLM
jgi:hypothetical protein